MPGQHGELAGDCDPGDVCPLLACDALELMTKRSWVPAGVMRDLDEQPADVAVALLGDFAVVGSLGALVHARYEAEVLASFSGLSNRLISPIAAIIAWAVAAPTPGRVIKSLTPSRP